MKKNKLNSVIALCVLILTAAFSPINAQNKTIKSDVIIYGGTSTAIATAVQQMQRAMLFLLKSQKVMTQPNTNY